MAEATPRFCHLFKEKGDICATVKSMKYPPLSLSTIALVATLSTGTAFAATNCNPYQCQDGTAIDRCTDDGYVINYFAAPCLTHGGEMTFTDGSFRDVPYDHPNADAIAYVKAQGIVSGYPNGTYRPDQTINRAEFAKIIMESNFTQQALDVCDPSYFYFWDANKTAWYSPYLCLAAQHKIIGGYPDGSFKPAADINFVEAAKIIATIDNFYINGVGYHNSVTTDGRVLGPDLPASQDGYWYESYVRYLSNHAAIPLSISTLDHPLTRGEMAEMIYRLKTKNADKPSRTYEELAAPHTSWKKFNSQYFTLSFDVPVGFEVSDLPNTIAVTKGKFVGNAIGSDNAFLRITRFNQYITLDGEIANARKNLLNQTESMVTIDGEQFLQIEGDDYGRYEGDSAGKIRMIFFPKSVLEVQERPGNQTQDFDVSSIANAIIASMRFFSTEK